MRFESVLRLPTFAALHHRQFRLLWAGQSANAMARWMDQVARGWLLYELTNSPLQLGLVQVVQALPLFFFSPLAGSLADRYPRHYLILITQALAAANNFLLGLLIVTGSVQVWHVYATAFVMALAQVFLQPARAAMVADAVPSQLLTNAIGLNSIGWNVARTMGPALAGALIATLGTASCFAVQAIWYLLAVVWTPGHGPSAESASVNKIKGSVSSLARSIVEGWRFSWRDETVRAALLINLGASLLIMPFTTLLPIFARDILDVGATGQGWLLTAMGVGALISAVLIASYGNRLPRGILMLGGVTTYGLFVAAFAISPWFELSLGLMVLIGLVHVSSYALVQTVIQTYSPADLRGRTMAIFQMGEVVATLGGMLAGSMASGLGVRWTAATLGVAGTIFTLGIAVALPSARHIR